MYLRGLGLCVKMTLGTGNTKYSRSTTAVIGTGLPIRYIYGTHTPVSVLLYLLRKGVLFLCKCYSCAPFTFIRRFHSDPWKSYKRDSNVIINNKRIVLAQSKTFCFRIILNIKTKSTHSFPVLLRPVRLDGMYGHRISCYISFVYNYQSVIIIRNFCPHIKLRALYIWAAVLVALGLTVHFSVPFICV